MKTIALFSFPTSYFSPPSSDFLSTGYAKLELRRPSFVNVNELFLFTFLRHQEPICYCGHSSKHQGVLRVNDKTIILHLVTEMGH